ncbi:hypothetical protein PENTCL1PPCAC_11407, partial [Pristionchus entomophagus]
MTAFGIKGVVVYFSPCGKRLGSFSEVIRYLSKNDTGPVNREQFTFSPKVIVGEFFVGVPKNGQLVNVKFTEEDVKAELKRLQEERTKKMGEEREKREEKRKEIMKKEREDKQKQRKDEGIEEKEKEKEEGGEPKRRAVEDLTLEEIRPLPSFKRINGLEMGGEAIGYLLMTVQFMENFKKTLQFDNIPSLEDLSRGCMGDPSSHLLSILSTLLSRSLTHLSSTRRFFLHGKSLSEIPVTETNRDELLRLILSQSDGEGPKLSSVLSSSSFLSLSPDQKAAVMGTIVNELVCSSAVRSQLEGHLEEVTKLKGERWMKEGKMRALRNHQTRRRKKRNGEEESEIDHHPESPERSIKFTPGIGQCEVLSLEEEALNDDEIDASLHDLGVKSDDLSSSINALNSRVRFFPIGEDRYHRLYWALPSDFLPTLIESIESGHRYNPACDLSICETDPISIQIDSFIDPEVIGCLEDTIDRLVDGGGEAKRRKLGLRLMGNPEKRGWWTVTSKDVDQWKANLHQRGLRERVLHRSITRNDLIDDLPLGEISIGRIEKRVNGEIEDIRRRKELNKKLIDLQYLSMEERIIDGEIDEDSKVTIESLKRKLLSIQESIPNDRFNFNSTTEKDEEEGKKEEKREEKVDELDEWRRMTEQCSTTSQLGLSTQLLCSFLTFSSSWLCSICLFPSSSSSFLLCSSCSQSRIHPSCLSHPQPFLCIQCHPKIALIDEEDDQIIDINDEDRKCGLPSKGGIKRRAEPNSFVVPPSMVNGLGRNILDEMQELEGCEFFASPVDLDEVPSYSLLIDKPMDLGTISQKIDRSGYSDAEDLYSDIMLVFSNCNSFNEDDSEIGEAGIRISRFCAKRWRQLKYNLSKRVKRMKID